MLNREIEALNKIKGEVSTAWFDSFIVDCKNSEEFSSTIEAINKIIDDAIKAEIEKRKQTVTPVKWTDRLSSEVYTRLCECRSTKEDLPVLVNAKWAFFKDEGKDKKGFTKEDALLSILELLDANGLSIPSDLTREEYDELKMGA